MQSFLVYSVYLVYLVYSVYSVYAVFLVYSHQGASLLLGSPYRGNCACNMLLKTNNGGEMQAQQSGWGNLKLANFQFNLYPTQKILNEIESYKKG